MEQFPWQQFPEAKTSLGKSFLEQNFRQARLLKQQFVQASLSSERNFLRQDFPHEDFPQADGLPTNRWTFFGGKDSLQALSSVKKWENEFVFVDISSNGHIIHFGRTEVISAISEDRINPKFRWIRSSSISKMIPWVYPTFSHRMTYC